MYLLSEVNAIRKMAETTTAVSSEGICFFYVDKDTVTWTYRSAVYDELMKVDEMGMKFDQDSPILQAMAAKMEINNLTPANEFGIKLRTNFSPIIDDETGECVGLLVTTVMLRHPVEGAFKHFAPVLAEMFPEGAIMFTSDIEKMTQVQGSSKFNTSNIYEGLALQENDVVKRTLKSKQPMSEELPMEAFGVPSVVWVSPLFHEESNDPELTIGVIMPKKIAAELRAMSNNLGNGLSGISAAIEQLAASASSIHENELRLDTEIKEINTLSNEINNISVFIKEIADETKMLGLNAAIEAARAGDSGKGFGVVADEIRKLSEQSKSTVPKINEFTSSIKTKVQEVGEMSKTSLHSSQEQAAATEEITASIEEISAMAEELDKIAKML